MDAPINKRLISQLPFPPNGRDLYKVTEVLELTRTDEFEYQLLDIEALDTKEYRQLYDKIFILDLTNNCISNLKLKDYNQLETLIATNNKISQVDLHLKNLRKLDLSKNYIKKMFELIDLPNLRELNLSQNSISEISFDSFKYVKATLNTLDISQNLVRFADVIDFASFAETFGQNMKELTVFQLTGNPFTTLKRFKDHYVRYIKFFFAKIKVIDFKIVENNINENLTAQIVKEKMLNLEKSEGISIIAKVNNTKKIDQIDLKTLNYHLLKINQLGRINDKIMEEVEDMIELYLNNIKIEHGTHSNNLEDKELDDFETFLDYIEKIIDSAPGYDKKVYSLLGKFATIKLGKFTSRALACIKQRVSPDNANDLTEVLNVILVFIKETPKDKIPVPIIEGLKLFIDESNLINSMKIIVKIIIQKGEQIDTLSFNQKTRSSATDVILYSVITSFISLSMEVKELYNEIIKMDKFITACVINLKSILGYSDDFIVQNEDVLNIFQNLLHIIKNLCLLKRNEDSAQLDKSVALILGSGLRDRIEQKLDPILQMIFKKGEGDDNKEMLNKEASFKVKKECMSLIITYGALLSNSTDLTKFLQPKSLPMKIISILSQNEIIDPLIIHGACDFTYYLIINPKITENVKNFSAITTKLYNLRYLLPFLFPQKPEYHKICAIAAKYGDFTCERGKPISISMMDSPILNNLFISITILMSFFGINSQKNIAISPICKDICAELNNLSRDSALTNCLLLPNEEVKLSVVKCLFSIDVEQLDPEELTSIYKQMSYISSLTGKMQTIVSIIFLIMNKWFLSNLRKKEYNNIETCKEAIFLAIDLLHKNDSKKSQIEADNIRKTNLSAILIVFLINVSTFEYTKKYFSDPKNRMILNHMIQAEEENSSLNYYLPLEIEKCHIGWSITNLLSIIKSGVINPYNYISLRIMIHIGDVLMNKGYNSYEINYKQKPDEIMEFLANEMRNREKHRIKEESKNWREQSDKDIPKRFSSSKDLRVEQQTFVKNFHIFLQFVLGQCSEKQISKLSRIFEKKFSKEIDNIKYSTLESPKMEDILSVLDGGGNLSDDEKEEEDEGQKEEDNNNGNMEDEKLYDRFKQFLREEDYTTTTADKTKMNFDYIQNELFHFNHYGYQEELQRIKEEETPNNPYLRGLFIAAFFRCIYAVLEKAEDKTVKEEMILILYQKDNLKMLCLLAECTKFVDNNTATKFLNIVRHVLRNSKLFYHQFQEAEKIKRKEEISNDYLNKIGKISYIIRKIIRVFKKELNVEKDSHKLLLSEVCQCAELIIFQLQILNFVHVKIREQTLEKMIDYEVINVFIQMIKEYMNKEAEAKGGEMGGSFGFQLLEEMVQINANIIGEYMDKCQSRRYDILESFTRGYMFERVKMRKSFIKEIIENSRISNLKSRLMQKNQSNTTRLINYLAPVYVTNYKHHKSKLRLMIVSDNEIDFINISNEKEIDYLVDYSLDDSLRISIEKINTIIAFDYLNRILIRTDENEYGFFFYKMNISTAVKKILKELNNKIVIYNNVLTFSTEKTNIIQSINDILKNKLSNKLNFNLLKKSEDQETPLLDNEENQSEIKSNHNDDPNNGNNNNNDSNNNDKNNNNENNDTNVTIVNCLVEISNFCDIFSNMFSKNEMVKNAKVLVIGDGSIRIYTEKFTEWESLNAAGLFESISRFPDSLPFYNIGSFEKCFTYVSQYDTTEFEKLKLQNADIVQLKRPNKSIMSIEIVDDLSYVKIKQALGLQEEYDEFNNN